MSLDTDNDYKIEVNTHISSPNLDHHYGVNLNDEQWKTLKTHLYEDERYSEMMTDIHSVMLEHIFNTWLEVK